jgi:hypothetical protein
MLHKIYYGQVALSRCNFILAKSDTRTFLQKEVYVAFIDEIKL